MLIHSDRRKAFLFNRNFRFIDYLVVINGGNVLLELFRDIYPESLELKMEHTGTRATFLYLEITVQGGKFFFKLFDKRNA